MFIRQCYRIRNGKRYAYWALVESRRTQRGPRQHIVSYIGQADEMVREGIKQAAQGSTDRQRKLFDDVEPEYAEVDVKRVRVERCREFGGPWLGLQMMRLLGLDELFAETIPSGREDIPWPMMAAVLVLSRLCEPSSELHIAEHFYRHSAIPDLLGVPADKVNDDRLNRSLDALLPHKDALQVFLKERLGEMFDLDYDLLLYDVTSTYFEGQAKGNEQAQRGYSRDSRGDCKQVCIALVVSRNGIPQPDHAQNPHRHHRHRQAPGRQGHAFIVMPNHIHAVVSLAPVGAGFKPALPTEPTAQCQRAGLKPAPTDPGPAKHRGVLPEIVRALKTFSAKRINQTQCTPVSKNASKTACERCRKAAANARTTRL